MSSHVLPLPATSSSRVLEILAHTPLFRGLSREELARVARFTSQVSAARGEVLFHRGDACAGFHIVAYGQVKLAVGTAGGAERVLEILGPGRSFGEAVVFTGAAYPVTATALADSLLLHVGRDGLFGELDREPQLARRMLAGLSARLHSLVKEVEALTLHSGTQRVIGYLARLGEGGEAGSVELPAQKALVASQLDLTPEYFSRILHELSAALLIRVEGRRIVILDATGLRAYGSEGAAKG